MIRDLPGEIWRPIIGTRDYYVSNKGRVLSRRKRVDVLMTPYLGRNGTSSPRINFQGNIGPGRNNVAMLVYESFIIGKRYSKKTFSWHAKDGDMTNCAQDNIERYVQYHISRKKLDKIMDYFWTNYDNDDATIAKKFGLSKKLISDNISRELDKHFARVNKRVNNN